MPTSIERLEQYVDFKVKEFHKTCLTDTFDNVCFWAFKEMQAFITHLKSESKKVLNTKEQILGHLNCLDRELQRGIESLENEDHELAIAIIKLALKRSEDIDEILKDARE